MNMWKVL